MSGDDLHTRLTYLERLAVFAWEREVIQDAKAEIKTLQAEREAYRDLANELSDAFFNSHWQAQIERLRTAGDALVDAVERQQWSTVDVAVAAWLEARHEREWPTLWRAIASAREARREQ